jgi:ATP-binding cassette subfamily C protein
MDGGKIVETGTHDQLMVAGGKYAAMWAAQADSYRAPLSTSIN